MTMVSIVGQTIDNYRVIEALGEGGMGIVFKAIDLNLEKIVALKMIHPFLARDENFVTRFKTEAKALAKLEDRNIVSVYAMRENEHGLFMIMEYVHGKTLSELIHEKGKFTTSETLVISKQIIHAINCAHQKGVIHRDIKPNNVLLSDDGTAKVMDFGLAKLMQDQNSQHTVTKFAAGTLHYMSPEQIRNPNTVDKRSDIYALGITMYEMLTGRTPFAKSDSEYNVQKQIVTGKIASPLDYNPDIPKQFIKIIMKAIDKDMEKRYQNLNEMLEDINRITVDMETTRDDEKTRVITSEVVPSVSKSFPKKYFVIPASLLVIFMVSYFILFNKGTQSVAENSDGKKTVLNNNNEKVVRPAFSRLSITSTPLGASVFIKEKMVGKTPYMQDSLQPGMYSIAMKMDGYESWKSSEYKLIPGENPLNIKLKQVPSVPTATSTLILKTDLPASIYIDGAREASSSKLLTKTELPAGRHTLKFEHPEYGVKELTVNTALNQRKEITVFYQQKVNIQSLNTKDEPFWGTIYINNKTVGETPYNLNLLPGKYEITVKKTGYKTREDIITLDIKPLVESMTHYLVFHLD